LIDRVGEPVQWTYSLPGTTRDDCDLPLQLRIRLALGTSRVLGASAGAWVGHAVRSACADGGAAQRVSVLARRVRQVRPEV